MRKKDNFEEKDWMKAAKGFAKQVYAKGKRRRMAQERRINDQINDLMCHYGWED